MQTAHSAVQLVQNLPWHSSQRCHTQLSCVLHLSQVIEPRSRWRFLRCLMTCSSSRLYCSFKISYFCFRLLFLDIDFRRASGSSRLRMTARAWTVSVSICLIYSNECVHFIGLATQCSRYSLVSIQTGSFLPHPLVRRVELRLAKLWDSGHPTIDCAVYDVLHEIDFISDMSWLWRMPKDFRILLSSFVCAILWRVSSQS